jgi:hypothetical protein
VKLLRSAKDRFVFQLGRREKELLAQILRLYPCIPAAHQPLSKTGNMEQSSQRLLDEALAEQRQENRKQVEELLADSRRLKQHERTWALSLTSAELEQLLQILNDVRVGSWVMLGSPEPRLELLDEKMAPHVWAMEMAGYFQMRFLEVLDGGQGHEAGLGSQL